MRLHSSVPTIGPIRPEVRRALLKHVESLSQDTLRLRQFTEYKALIDRLVEPGTPCFEFKPVYSRNSLKGAVLFMHAPEKKTPALERICDLIDEALYERGYRKGAKTHQEHDLLGSDVEMKYSMHPYVPMIVIDRKGISIKKAVEEARLARSLELFWGALGMFYGLKGKLAAGVTVLLEGLGGNGETIRDPRPIDRRKFLECIAMAAPLEEAIEKSVIQHRKSQDYPHKRN